jgi:transglutaminase-like putative cysteine protease
MVLALTLLVPAAALGGPPRYVILTSPAKRVEAVFTSDFTAPELKATEWVIVAARPPELPGQTDVSVSAEPGAREDKELSDLKRPILVWRIPANDDSLKTHVRVRVKTEATLLERRLVERERALAAGVKPPKVTPLAEGERKLFLAPTPRLNHDAQDFQDWLKANKLRRGSKEADVDFALRAFQVVREKFTYRFPIGHDGKATSMCKAGKGDCGCMSTVFVCACRANGIPARELVGRWAASAKGDDIKIHVKAEFYAENVGWVPVDVTQGNGTPGKDGLTFFGNDPGDFLVMHLDGDLEVDAIHFGRVPAFRLQGVARWATASGGNWDKSEAKEDWQVKTSPPPGRRK